MKTASNAIPKTTILKTIAKAMAVSISLASVIVFTQASAFADPTVYIHILNCIGPQFSVDVFAQVDGTSTPDIGLLEKTETCNPQSSLGRSITSATLKWTPLSNESGNSLSVSDSVYSFTATRGKDVPTPINGETLKCTSLN